MTTRRTKMSLAKRLSTLREMLQSTRPAQIHATRRMILRHHIDICERAQARAEDTAIARFKMSTARAFMTGLN